MSEQQLRCFRCNQILVENYRIMKDGTGFHTDMLDCIKYLLTDNATLSYKVERLKQELENPTRTGVCEVCHDKSVLMADKLIAENKRLNQELEEAGLQACNDEAEIRWLETALREIADQAGTTRDADWARRRAAGALKGGEDDT